MKVGLVPLLYNEYNYGGILQFYALQKVLKDKKIEGNIIYFDSNARICEPVLKKYQKIILSIKSFAYKTASRGKKKKLEKNIKKRRQKIDLFKEKTFFSTIDANKLHFKEYQAIICGSDQIWNPAWAKRRCFLEFVPDEVNKVIYAASLGCEEMSAEVCQVFKPRVERLQHVSVREYSAKKLLDSFVDRNDIGVVLDPTLLLLPEEWMSIVKPPSYENYIFTYFLGDYKDKIQYIKNVAEEKGLKIINIPNASGEKLDENDFGDIKIMDADPGEFLGLIKSAQYIFTDSFHACVFSIMFKKQFLVSLRDGSERMYGRINTLFQNFDIPDRRMDITMPFNTIENIEYTNENHYMELREKYLDYLFRSISNE